jgi:hypothetical protein
MEPERAQQLSAWEESVRDDVDCGQDIEACNVRCLFGLLAQARMRIVNLEYALAESDKDWAVAREQLVSALNLAEGYKNCLEVVETSQHEEDLIRETLSSILTRSVNQIRVPIGGREHSWHDLPSQIEILQKQIAASNTLVVEHAKTINRLESELRDKYHRVDFL